MDKIELSPVPASCTSGVPCVLGIDEAGRGPVLGPMTYACAYWPEAEQDAIAAMGFDDSKALSEAKRDDLFKRLGACGRIGYVIFHISPETISSRMLQRTPYSLNAMSHDAAIDMVRRVREAGVNVTHVFVDTVGDPGQYEQKLTRAFRNQIKFTVSKKADSLFKCVSAASICAKVSRDHALRNWVFRETLLSNPAAAAAAASSSSGAGAGDSSSGGAFESEGWGYATGNAALADMLDDNVEGSDSAAAAEAAACAPASPGDAAFDDEEAAFNAAMAGAGGEDDDDDDDDSLAGIGKGDGGGEEEDEDEEDEEEEDVVVPAAKRPRLDAAAAATAAPEEPAAKPKKVTAAAKKAAAAAVPLALHPSTAGSGYPGDPLTKAWLGTFMDPVFGYPSVVRFSWATTKDLLDKEAVSVEWEEEAEKPGGPGGAPTVTLGAFFGSSSGGAGGGAAAAANKQLRVTRGRAPFFRRRGLESVDELLL